MGLAERRRVADIKEKHQARYQAEMDSACGFHMPFEIDVKTFPEDKTVLDCYDYYHESYGPGLVPKVFKELCSDKIGTEAVKAKIKKVIFQNTAKSGDNPGDKSVSLEGDTLFVRESFYGYSDKLYGEADLKSTLENML